MAIERNSGGAVLVIETDRGHPHDWNTKEVVPVTPSDIQRWIIEALRIGWNPEGRGQFFAKVINDRVVKV